MTEQECRKRYDDLCNDYGKAKMEGEYIMFRQHCIGLNDRQYDLVIKRVKSRLSEFNRIPVPSMFDKAVSELRHEYGLKREQKVKFEKFPDPDSLNKRFGVIFVFELWATEARCVSDDTLRKGSVATMHRLKAELDSKYYAGALDNYFSLVNQQYLKSYIQERSL